MGREKHMTSPFDNAAAPSPHLDVHGGGLVAEEDEQEVDQDGRGGGGGLFADDYSSIPFLLRLLMYQSFIMDPDGLSRDPDHATLVINAFHVYHAIVDMITLLLVISLLKHFLKFDVFGGDEQDQVRRRQSLSPEPDILRTSRSPEEIPSTPPDDHVKSESSSKSKRPPSSVISTSVSLSSSLSSLDTADLDDEEEEEVDKEKLNEEEEERTSSYGNYSFNSNHVEISTCYNVSEIDPDDEDNNGGHNNRGLLSARVLRSEVDGCDFSIRSESIDSQLSWLQERYGEKLKARFCDEDDDEEEDDDQR